MATPAEIAASIANTNTSAQAQIAAANASAAAAVQVAGINSMSNGSIAAMKIASDMAMLQKQLEAEGRASALQLQATELQTQTQLQIARENISFQAWQTAAQIAEAQAQFQATFGLSWQQFMADTALRQQDSDLAVANYNLQKGMLEAQEFARPSDWVKQAFYLRNAPAPEGGPLRTGYHDPRQDSNVMDDIEPVSYTPSMGGTGPFGAPSGGGTSSLHQQFASGVGSGGVGSLMGGGPGVPSERIPGLPNMSGAGWHGNTYMAGAYGSGYQGAGTMGPGLGRIGGGAGGAQITDGKKIHQYARGAASGAELTPTEAAYEAPPPPPVDPEEEARRLRQAAESASRVPGPGQTTMVEPARVVPPPRDQSPVIAPPPGSSPVQGLTDAVSMPDGSIWRLQGGSWSALPGSQAGEPTPGAPTAGGTVSVAGPGGRGSIVSPEPSVSPAPGSGMQFPGGLAGQWFSPQPTSPGGTAGQDELGIAVPLPSPDASKALSVNTYSNIGGQAGMDSALAADDAAANTFMKQLFDYYTAREQALGLAPGSLAAPYAQGFSTSFNGARIAQNPEKAPTLATVAAAPQTPAPGGVGTIPPLAEERGGVQGPTLPVPRTEGAVRDQSFMNQQEPGPAGWTLPPDQLQQPQQAQQESGAPDPLAQRRKRQTPQPVTPQDVMQQALYGIGGAGGGYVRGYAGGNQGLPQLPADQPVVVGENGPEILDPPPGTRVIPMNNAPGGPVPMYQIAPANQRAASLIGGPQTAPQRLDFAGAAGGGFAGMSAPWMQRLVGGSAYGGESVDLVNPNQGAISLPTVGSSWSGMGEGGQSVSYTAPTPEQQQQATYNNQFSQMQQQQQQTVDEMSQMYGTASQQQQAAFQQQMAAQQQQLQQLQQMQQQQQNQPPPAAATPPPMTSQQVTALQQQIQALNAQLAGTTDTAAKAQIQAQIDAATQQLTAAGYQAAPGAQNQNPNTPAGLGVNGYFYTVQDLARMPWLSALSGAAAGNGPTLFPAFQQYGGPLQVQDPAHPDEEWPEVPAPHQIPLQQWLRMTPMEQEMAMAYYQALNVDPATLSALMSRTAPGVVSGNATPWRV